MKKFTITATTVGALVAAALGLAGAAAAVPTGGSSAGDTVKSLQAEGYNVQLNGSATAPLSQCIVTGVHGEPAAGSNRHSSRPSTSTLTAQITERARSIALDPQPTSLGVSANARPSSPPQTLGLLVWLNMTRNRPEWTATGRSGGNVKTVAGNAITLTSANRHDPAIANQ